jgi:adenosylcobinamide kinase / adenosylcobinamide-phosphate guanylyltransferase
MNQLPKPRHLFITGGSRSGKSKFAEIQAGQLGGQVIYLATAEAQDAEMAERIFKHQQRRPADWLTIEAPLQVIEMLGQYQAGHTVLLDCLTMYLSNLYFKYEKASTTDKLSYLIHQETAHLAEVIASSTANLVIVTNEVGWGIVPENPLARIFRDLAGLVNQQIAVVCDEVYLVVSGIPVKIKGVCDVQKS